MIRKFESVLDKNSDFNILKQICEGASKEPLSSSQNYFEFANITSLDVERSFSTLKHIYSARRTNLTETSVETYLMIGIFHKFYPHILFTDNS